MKKQGIKKQAYLKGLSKRRGTVFFISFLLPEIFNFFLLCKLGTVQTHIIKNISGNKWNKWQACCPQKSTPDSVY